MEGEQKHHAHSTDSESMCLVLYYYIANSSVQHAWFPIHCVVVGLGKCVCTCVMLCVNYFNNLQCLLCLVSSGSVMKYNHNSYLSLDITILNEL